MTRSQIAPKTTIQSNIEGTEYRITVTQIQKDVEKYGKENNKRNGCIYFFQQGETILDNLENRRNRPVKVYRQVLDAVMEACDMKFVGPKDHYDCGWSQKAGCNCGCSPAFIFKNPSWESEYTDIFVDFTFEKVDEKKDEVLEQMKAAGWID
jgi:hypothetical protein